MDSQQFKNNENKTIQKLFEELAVIPSSSPELYQQIIETRKAYIYYRIFRDYSESNLKLAKRMIALNIILVSATVVGAVIAILSFVCN